MQSSDGVKLEKKVKETERIIKTALDCFNDSFNNPAISWSSGKDSTVMLHIMRELKIDVPPDIPVYFVDTKRHFKETYDFRDRIHKEWNLNLTSILSSKNPDYNDRENCCHVLKTEPLLRAIETLNIDCLFVGIRHDEHPERGKEFVFSPRKTHWRVHPILHWTVNDIWEYIKKHNLPYNPLYDKGFKSIGCMPCTKPTEGDERSGRSHDKEKIMRKLRLLGYF